MNELFCLIVGSGISGLTLANLLVKQDILLIEQDDELGGAKSYLNFAASNSSFQQLANIKDDKFYDDLIFLFN
ncbi:NAD(P)/FAD-dependent oxidoreductase [Campylobacter sp. RM12640]|uniref:NAD(P)-binding protein n=1 Tax=unclassified Campylobacter TaxID=2593542 RepID=UPI00301443FD|nr:NAD(P)/FAD-dependent oxidoreductase [Campylobacter sp. RM12640]MBZ7988606.1 NAD(P)/FAD-dependent oxidoreductase [Campylobacter sp. RM12635]